MRTSLRRTITRAALAATTVALVGSGAVVAPVQASPASNTSADWLASQLNARDVVHNGEFDFDDFGLTLDFYFAFGQLDTKAGKRAAILHAIELRIHEYVDAFSNRSAGAIGKALTAAEAAGLDPTTYADENYVASLEALVVTTGDETGHAKDSPSDFSNTFGQAYVATALAGADSDLADEAAEFLLKQQCSDGFFREGMTSSDFTCDAGTGQQSTPSVDATATAAIAAAALAAEGPLPVRADAAQAFADAVAWLVSQQRDSGAFVGNGAANSNSTGLAASALIVAGKDGKAKRAARWINELRVTKKLVASTDFKKADLGAIAYSKAAFKTGKSEGITTGARGEWRRATAQAAPALDLLG